MRFVDDWTGEGKEGIGLHLRYGCAVGLGGVVATTMSSEVFLLFVVSVILTTMCFCSNLSTKNLSQC